MSSKLTENINCIAELLAERDIPEIEKGMPEGGLDLLVLLGNGLIGSIYSAAQVLKSGAVKQLLISGGVGHSTHYLRTSITNFPNFSDIDVEDRAEADILADVLVHKFDINPTSILIEKDSTNCGTNAEQSRILLDKLGIPLSKMVIIQDPTMQRRSQACFERAWQDKPEVQILSYAPFIPRIEESETGYRIVGNQYPTWEPERFISLVLGEIPRLRDDENGYGPNGRNYFGHVEIPTTVLEAYKQIYDNNPDLVREIPA